MAKTRSPASAVLRIRGSRGFTLLEMLIVVAIFALIATGVMTTFMQGERLHQYGYQKVELQQNARAAMERLTRDLRMAGSGLGGITVNTSDRYGNPVTLFPVTSGYDSLGTLDSVRILAAFSDESIGLRDDMPGPSAEIKADSIPDSWQVGDLVIVTNGIDANLFSITHIQDPPGNIQHHPDTLYNAPGGHNEFPADGYGPPDGRMLRVQIVTYRVSRADTVHPKLVRASGAAVPETLALNLTSLRFLYQLQDGSVSANPGDLSQIREVQVAARVRTDQTRQGTVFTDSLRTSVRPRSLQR